MAKRVWNTPGVDYRHFLLKICADLRSNHHLDMNTALLAEALILALYGISSVFLFLTLLVGCTMLMSYWLGGDADSEKDAVQPAVDAKLLAAIAVSVKHYRHRQTLTQDHKK